MAYKDTPKSMATIGSELNAQFLIEGCRVRDERLVLRIRCTLNRVADQAQVWSRGYDRNMTSLAGVGA